MKKKRPLNAPDSPLSAKQEIAALALAGGKTQAQAAKKCGAGTRTIKTWLASKPEFSQRVQQLRTELTVRALGVLTDSTVSAARTLDELCSFGESENVRLSSARAIIELGTKLREHVEFEKRISTLEAEHSH